MHKRHQHMKPNNPLVGQLLHHSQPHLQDNVLQLSVGRCAVAWVQQSLPIILNHLWAIIARVAANSGTNMSSNHRVRCWDNRFCNFSSQYSISGGSTFQVAWFQSRGVARSFKVPGFQVSTKVPILHCCRVRFRLRSLQGSVRFMQGSKVQKLHRWKSIGYSSWESRSPRQQSRFSITSTS